MRLCSVVTPKLTPIQWYRKVKTSCSATGKEKVATRLRKAFGLLLLMLALAACGNDTNGVRQKDVECFAEKAKLVIPDSAVATDFRWVFSMDGMELLRLELPAADLPAFLAESGLDNAFIRTTDRAANKAIFQNFLTKNPVKFRAGQKQLGDGFFLDVLIDDDDETTKNIYLLWAGT